MRMAPTIDTNKSKRVSQKDCENFSQNADMLANDSLKVIKHHQWTPKIITSHPGSFLELSDGWFGWKSQVI